MFKCQEQLWTENHRFWLSVAEKLDYEHKCAIYDTHANKLYDWSMLFQMILHLVIVPEVHVHCLKALGCKERTIIDGLILSNF